LLLARNFPYLRIADPPAFSIPSATVDPPFCRSADPPCSQLVWFVHSLQDIRAEILVKLR